MKIGIIGLPQTGKKTLFALLTGQILTETAVSRKQPVKSVAQIKDPRFDALVALYKPEKATRARIDIELLPKLEQDAIVKGDIFKDILDADALCHVVRAFKDESIYHVQGSVDHMRDIEAVNAELILHDLLFVEKRLERIEIALKKKQEATLLLEQKLLFKIKQQLDNNDPLRFLDLDNEEKKIIAGYPFITSKEMVLVVNVSEDDISNSDLLHKIQSADKHHTVNVMLVSAKIESEIASLESAQEKQEYLAELGITEPAVDKMSRICMKTLNLSSFFTVGTDEVKQWTFQAGSAAPRAGGSIHSDIEKGFIKAEVMKSEDLLALGSEAKVKEAGKFYLKGKDYIVEDGDTMGFLFNV